MEYSTKVVATALSDHIKDVLEEPGVRQNLIERVDSGLSKANGFEEIFTKDFLCPAIADYFCSQSKNLQLSKDRIEAGLGCEGSQTTPGFSFSPASENHLFTKSEFLNSMPPDSWFKGGNLSNKRAYPDFAIRKPLPCSILGEVKLIRSGNTKTAMSALYEAARQALFYMGAFKGQYEASMAVIVDASDEHLLQSTLELVSEGVLDRFNSTTNIYLCCITLR